MAGARGMKVIGMNSALESIRACWSPYQKGAAEGQSKDLQVGDGVGMCVVIYVAETMEVAERDIRPSINHYYGFLSGARPGGEWDRRSFLNAGDELTNEDREADWFDFLQSRDMMWVGTADYVAEKINKFQEELGLRHIMLLQQFPGIPIEKILASMSRFGEHVVPRFQSGS